MCAVSLLAVLTLYGCSRRSGQDGAAQPFTEPVYDWDTGSGESLTVWGIYPDMERSYLKKAFARFEELTSDSLEIVQIPKDEFEGRMLAAINGETEKPDILFNYGGTNIELFDPDNNFYDFSNAEWVDDLTDTSINQTVYNGKIIGLPHWEASVSGTLYNKKIFKKYQLKTPETQEEFMETCEILSEQGIIPLYLPAGEISMLLYQFPLDTLAETPSVLQGLNSGKLGYAEIPEMTQVVNWYRTMARKGYLGETYRTDRWAGMSEAMESGRYAMMLCWDTWLYTDFEGEPSDFGLMPAFIGIPEEGTFEGPNLGLFIVNKNSKKLDSALNFITFLADPYNYNAAFEGIYTAPVFKNQVASISTPQYLEAERLIERKFHDSAAWLRIRGFSQMDASRIIEYMDADSAMTASECLTEMDELRRRRIFALESGLHN